MSAYIHQGLVYFVARGDYIKIGFSSGNLRRRLADLATTGTKISPEGLDAARPLVLLHTIPGCVIRDERRLHGLFAAHHAAGEWFHFTPDFVEQLARLEYVTYAESLQRFRRGRAALKRTPLAVEQVAA